MLVRDVVARGRSLAQDMRAARHAVAPSRYDVIARCELMEVRRYRQSKVTSARPLLLVPPLMARSFVFDLHAQRSMVGHLLDAGYDVFVVDWGDPGPDDRGRSFEDYVVRWMPRAIEAVWEAADRVPLGLVGYCLGGLFSLWHLGLREDPRVDRLAIIASPIDAHAMGTLMSVARLGVPAAETFGRIVGNIPGPLSSTVFALTQPVANLTRWRELWQHADDPEFVRGFVAMNAWMGNFASLPREMFVDLAERFLRDNASFRGELRLGDGMVDLGRVRVPVLAIAGERDVVVSPRAVHAIQEVIGSRELRCITAPGGHAGVLAGAHAPREVWDPVAAWMAADALSSVA